MNKAGIGSPHTYMYSVELVSVSKQSPHPAVNDIFTSKRQSRYSTSERKVTLKKSMYATNDVQLLK